MNNQVKLIDQTTLMEAIAEEKSRQEQARESLRIDHVYWEFHEGAATILEWLEKEIKKDKFTPDTPPVPTIKPIRTAYHPDLGLVGVISEGEELVTVVDCNGQRHDVFILDLEV